MHISNRLSELGVDFVGIGGNSSGGIVYSFPKSSEASAFAALREDAFRYGHPMEFSDGTSITADQVVVETLIHLNCRWSDLKSTTIED
jgi:hypothetical protein